MGKKKITCKVLEKRLVRAADRAENSRNSKTRERAMKSKQKIIKQLQKKCT